MALSSVPVQHGEMATLSLPAQGLCLGSEHGGPRRILL